MKIFYIIHQNFRKMIRSTTQFRGHKTQRAQYLIPYYTDTFFNKEGEKEKAAKCEKVSFPVKVVQTDEETRTNTQNIKVKVIDFLIVIQS